MLSPVKIRAWLVRLAATLLLAGVFGVTLPDLSAFAAPGSGESKPALKKKKARRDLKARGKRRATPKKLVEEDQQAEEGGIKPRQVFVGVVTLALLVLIVRHRREEHAEAAPEREALKVKDSSRPAHEPRAVVLDPKAGIDPFTAQVTNAGIAAENAAAAKEIERLVTGDLKLKIDEQARVELRRATSDRLPGTFGQHFDQLPGEQVLWTAPFHVAGFTEGELAVTNQRLLAVHEDRRVTFLPPGISKELRRHQIARSQITAVEETATKRPVFLAAGILTCLFYPIGTALACVAIGCYFAVLRPVLCVASAVGLHQQRRFYPLIRSDIQDAKRHLAENQREQKKAG